jgi:hypothetical protein
VKELNPSYRFVITSDGEVISAESVQLQLEEGSKQIINVNVLERKLKDYRRHPEEGRELMVSSPGDSQEFF